MISYHQVMPLFVMLILVIAVDTTSAEPLRVIANYNTIRPGTTGTFLNFGQLNGVDPAISGRNIVFGACCPGGYYAYIDGELRVIANTVMKFPGSDNLFGFSTHDGSSPSISGANVAFGAHDGQPGPMAIVAYINGELRVIAKAGETPVPGRNTTFRSFFLGNGASPAISGENVVFGGMGEDFVPGLFAYMNGQLRLIADTTTLIPDSPIEGLAFGGFGNPSISGENIAFASRRGNISGVYAYINGELRKIVDTSTPVPADWEQFCSTGFADFGLLSGGVSISGENVAFRSVSAIVGYINGKLRLIADCKTTLPGSAETFGGSPVSPRISGENVVFAGGANDLGAAIFAYIDGSLKLIASENIWAPGSDRTFAQFFLFDQDHQGGEGVRPAISGENVVFSARPNGVYAYFPPEHGDVDDNDCLNLFDMAAFQRCLGATTLPGDLPDSCVSVFDFDGNNTVNLNDHSAFITEMTEGR